MFEHSVSLFEAVGMYFQISVLSCMCIDAKVCDSSNLITGFPKEVVHDM